MGKWLGGGRFQKVLPGEVLKGIHTSNVNELIFGQLNINSLMNEINSVTCFKGSRLKDIFH